LPQGTSLESVVGKMDVIPFFGASFNDYVPILICVFCLLNFLNAFGRVLKLLGMDRFEYSENFDDDRMTEGKMLLRKEKRKRGLKVDQTLL
jgi:hypothetical protein